MSTSKNPGKRTKNASLENALSKVYFEKQEGALCGQHCLNNAVQSHIFNAVDLATVAKDLDEKERETMAQFGTETEEYKEFINKPSINFDDTGFFGVQVLQTALKNLEMDLIPYNSTDYRAVKARESPLEQRLIITNEHEHWFSFRRFGLTHNTWLNLNSTLKEPQLLTDSYFTLLLKTYETDGKHTVFFVFGNIPENLEADRAFENMNSDDSDFGPGFKLGRADDSVGLSDANKSEAHTTEARNEAIRLRREAFLSRLQNQSGEKS